MQPVPMDFWFTMGSTYAYLAIMRLEEVTRPAGVAVGWRPFNFRTLLQERNFVPFPAGTAKTNYMWRDIERRALAYGFSARLPAPYPIKDSALANSVALLGMREGWGAAFVRTLRESTRQDQRSQQI
jgi:2-hydroxychromene-2-carboxylate isomerase